MTFKHLTSGRFLREWISHYGRLGIDIPEGKPGCNPNGMLAEGRLNFVQRLSS